MTPIKYISIALSIPLISLLPSCKHVPPEDSFKRISQDTIMVGNKTFVALREIDMTITFGIPMMDSIDTEKALEGVLTLGYINPPSTYQMTPNLYKSIDMRYLPYLILMYSRFPREAQSNQYLDDLIALCSHRIDDPKLFDLGKAIVAYQGLEHLYPDKYKWSQNDYAIGKNSRLDSLRVRVVAYNDRDALTRLEKYYRERDNEKELAVYYKVMLAYKGNGDLAERFYNVLKPHFKENPEFRNAVRVTLLRAAICDKDERALQLCDSLRFSLANYRLPQIPDRQKP